MTSIVVLTYNQLQDCTIPCIESIYKYTKIDTFELIVVDNNSQDVTGEYLKSIENKYPNIKIILNVENKGYSGGNNDGIKGSKGDFVVLLNNDTLVSENWLENLLKPFDKDKKIGLVGPISNSVGNEQRVNIDGLNEKNYIEKSKEYTTLNKDVVCETQRLGFFCVAIKRDLIDKIGLLDEKFGIGMFEDDDYCMRSIQAGYKNVFVEDSFVYHKGSVSFKKLTTEAYQEIFSKNKSYFLQKHGVEWSYSDIVGSYFHYLEQVAQSPQMSVRAEDIHNMMLFIKNLELNSNVDKLKALNQELMDMGNWATSMKQRLEKIDQNKYLRNLELYFDGKLSVGSIFKKLIKKLIPNSLLNKYRLYKNRASFQEIENNILKNKKIIVAFPIITWGFRFQRPQHILKELSKKGYTIIYLSLTMTPKGKKFDTLTESLTHVNFTKLEDNIFKAWLHSYEPINIYIDSIADENLHNLSLSIESILKKFKAKEVTYLVQFPGWSRLVFDLQSKVKGKVIFDCMDDHSGFTTNTNDALKEEIELIKKSDIVISSAQLLYDKNIKLNPYTIQVKNGTEFEHFNKAEKNGRLKHLAVKPIIGYYGAISDWFDMEIVEYCAKELPDYNFVMIGSTFGCDISKAEAINNIHFLGEIPYKELPGYFAYFDVCLIPFKLIPLTLATNPVKFYEYISAGKPVVSIRLPELVPYEEICYLVDTKEEFINKIEEALNESDKGMIHKRIELAKENSWAGRANEIYKNLGDI